MAAICASTLRSPQNKSGRFAERLAALRSIRELNVAQVQYFSQFGRYASSLAEWGPGADLPGGEKHGYQFALSLTPAGYQVTATPVGPGHRDRRVFSSDQSLVVRHDGSPLAATR
jgi:type IV pilus assembly protein PilA